MGRRNREFKNASRNFFPPPRRRRCTTTRCTEIGKISLSVWRPPIRPGSFVRRVARLFRTGMKINYFVNSCVTLAVTVPSLWATAAQGAIFQFPMSPPPFANPYFRPVLSFPAALSLYILSFFLPPSPSLLISNPRFESLQVSLRISPWISKIFISIHRYLLNLLPEMTQVTWNSILQEIKNYLCKSRRNREKNFKIELHANSCVLKLDKSVGNLIKFLPH